MYKNIRVKTKVFSFELMMEYLILSILIFGGRNSGHIEETNKSGYEEISENDWGETNRIPKASSYTTNEEFVNNGHFDDYVGDLQNGAFDDWNYAEVGDYFLYEDYIYGSTDGIFLHGENHLVDCILEGSQVYITQYVDYDPDYNYRYSYKYAASCMSNIYDNFIWSVSMCGLTIGDYVNSNDRSLQTVTGEMVLDESWDGKISGGLMKLTTDHSTLAWVTLELDDFSLRKWEPNIVCSNISKLNTWVN
ncbi:hypothetical protein ES708_11863 [subsurface metagenome]